MNLKIESDAEVYQTCKYGKPLGRLVLNVKQDKIVDADELQALRNAIKPRVIEDVILA